MLARSNIFIFLRSCLKDRNAEFRYICDWRITKLISFPRKISPFYHGYLNNRCGYKIKLKDHALLRVNRPYPLCSHVTVAELLIPVGHALGGRRVEAPRRLSGGHMSVYEGFQKMFTLRFSFSDKDVQTAFQCHCVLLWGNVSCVLRFDKFQRRASECIQTTYVDQGITISSMSSGRQSTCCRRLSLFSRKLNRVTG